MKKILLYILALFFAISCGNSYEEQKRLSRAERARLQREDSLALKIAVMPTLDCLPLYIVKEHALNDTSKLDLRLKYFTAQMDCDTALVGRSVEGAVSDLVRTERMKREGVKLDYITSTNAYWQLITNYKARIKKVEQLGDKMVAMTRYSATDFLTDYVLENIKTQSEVFRIQVNDVNIRLSMLLNNEMDAMWLTEPQATTARINGNVVIADSKNLKLSLGVLAVRSEVMKDKRRKVQMAELVKTYNQACDSINKNGVKHYADIIKKYMKANDKTISQLPKLKFVHVAAPKQADVDAVNRKK